MKVSREGVVLIKSFEGFRPRAVRDEDGRWVIGYGHTASAREGLTVGEQDAELLLQYDLMPVVKALNEQVSAPLNQHQFDALASFAVSVGVDRFLTSDVLQRLNAGQAGEAADALVGWPETVTPEVSLRRRAAERALFVADPAGPVHLADLLAAPLPPPPVQTAPVVETPIIRPDFGHAETVAEPAVEAPAPPPAALQLQRYSPYAAAIIGPLPGFAPLAQSAPVPVQEAPEVVEPEPVAIPEPVPVETVAAPEPAPEPVAARPVAPLVPPAPGPSPFPPMDEPLVLTPAVEADFVESEVRPVWPAEDRADPAAPEETVLFEDEPTLSVLRHEVEPKQPRRFDWADTGAFLIMGVVGLGACGASAASFRKAMLEESFNGDFILIGWVLALIGVICVGVSSWNLYVRAGKSS
nr:glycoside hydrolase family protein [Brevundimonas lenta]